MDNFLQKTIVIADTNPANLDVLGDILSKRDYKVLKVHDAKEWFLQLGNIVQICSSSIENCLHYPTLNLWIK